MNQTHRVAAPCLQLNQPPWSLTLSSADAAHFELQYHGKTHYIGNMEVMNNGQLLSVAQASWRFRHKPERLEQWGQIHHAETLSININYYFVDDGLVIEYLARNAVPTRLDIRHAIQALPAVTSSAPATSAPSSWQHLRNGLPSESLASTQKTALFREAFSAKQWIILNKL